LDRRIYFAKPFCSCAQAIAEKLLYLLTLSGPHISPDISESTPQIFQSHFEILNGLTN